MPLPSRAFSRACGHFRVSRVFARRIKKKEKLLVVYQGGLETVTNDDDDDDDGSETIAKKMNLRPFKLNHVYLDPLNMPSNTGDFSWSWILKDFIQVQKEEGKFVVVCPRPP